MSLIGLLTATEKQVHLGRLHMRPIQWHLKNNWRVPESLEKVIPVPKSLHPHLRWWLEESNVLLGQPLHPLKHALQIFTDASKEGWGTHLDEHTARGTWSLPESKLHINHLELQAVFLALKEFRTLVCNKTVLIATDNTTVVAYINKEGGMKSGSLCALLWKILSWCTRQQLTLKARHIPGRLNMIADKLSRLGQTIQNGHFIQKCSKLYATGGTSLKWTCLPPDSTTNYHSLSHRSQTPRHGQWMHSAYPGRTWTHTPSHRQPSWAKCGEAPGLPLQQNNSDCPRVAQHALVWGSSSNVKSDPTVSAQHTQLSVSAIQPGPSQEPVESEPTCLAPRASAIKEQGFSEAMAARIEAPQRGSTRSVYEAKWAIFTKWCLSNQVDFRAPPLKTIGSSCTCFRTRSCSQALLTATDQPLLTNWATPPLMSAKMRISLVSWTVSIETDPRAGGASPPGTCPWYYTS